MKLILILLAFGVFAYCNGQNLGGQAGGEIIWNDDLNINEMGSTPFISVSSHSPSFPLIIGVIEGAGGPAGGHDSGKSSAGEFGLWFPRVSYSGDHFISGGHSFSVTCTLTQFDQLKWTLNGSPITKFQDHGYTVEEIPAPQGFIGSRLIVANSKKEHAGDYKCTTFSPLSHTVYILGADESVGTTCDSGDGSSPLGLEGERCSHLRIVKWDTGSSEGTKLLKFGSSFSLHCNISQETKWYKNGTLITEKPGYKLLENSTLVIEKPTKDDVGVYRCETVGYTPAKSVNISVVYLQAKSLIKSTMVLEGDRLNLTCDVEGDPMPTITWKKDNINVEDAVNNSRFVLESNLKGTENASFIIEVADYSDRAEYMCFVQIGDILYNTTTFVRVKDMYAALWPFLGICAEVFILCLIIFIYEKRRAKADFEESDTDQPPEQKNTSEQNKDSVRHRK